MRIIKKKVKVHPILSKADNNYYYIEPTKDKEYTEIIYNSETFTTDIFTSSVFTAIKGGVHYNIYDYTDDFRAITNSSLTPEYKIPEFLLTNDLNTKDCYIGEIICNPSISYSYKKRTYVSSLDIEAIPIINDILQNAANEKKAILIAPNRSTFYCSLSNNTLSFTFNKKSNNVFISFNPNDPSILKNIEKLTNYFISLKINISDISLDKNTLELFYTSSLLENNDLSLYKFIENISKIFNVETLELLSHSHEFLDKHEDIQTEIRKILIKKYNIVDKLYYIKENNSAEIFKFQSISEQIELFNSLLEVLPAFKKQHNSLAALNKILNFHPASYFRGFTKLDKTDKISNVLSRFNDIYNSTEGKAFIDEIKNHIPHDKFSVDQLTCYNGSIRNTNSYIKPYAFSKEKEKIKKYIAFVDKTKTPGIQLKEYFSIIGSGYEKQNLLSSLFVEAKTNLTIKCDPNAYPFYNALLKIYLGFRYITGSFKFILPPCYRYFKDIGPYPEDMALTTITYNLNRETLVDLLIKQVDSPVCFNRAPVPFVHKELLLSERVESPFSTLPILSNAQIRKELNLQNVIEITESDELFKILSNK